ncbi:hypothetical protein Q5752_002538 [Cryptotrichosporon argae]
MSAAEHTRLNALDARRIIFQLQQAGAQSILDRPTPIAEIERALLHLRAIILRRPSKHMANSGGPLRARTLTGFLRCCVVLGAADLAQKVFRERLAEQQRVNAPIVDCAAFALCLTSARQWDTTTQVFGRPNHPVPLTLYTPDLVAHTMEAFLAMDRVNKAIKLFNLHESLNIKPTLAATAALVQAHLRNGNMDAARAIVVPFGRPRNSDIQLAILRGYRALGFDRDIERPILDDLQQLGIRPGTPIVNVLAQLRAEADDLDGAARMLDWLDWSGAAEEDLRPDAKTMRVAMAIASRRGNVDVMRRLWDKVLKTPGAITDGDVANLFVCLGRVGRADEVLACLAALVEQSGVPMPWFIPSTYPPGVQAFNAALSPACIAQGMDGLAKVFRLMRLANVKPDEGTVRNVLLFAKNQLGAAPHMIALLLDDLLARAPALRATVAHSDVILSAAMDDAQRFKKPLPTVSPRAEPSAGVIATEPVRTSMRRIAQSLRDRGERSSVNSLALRLRLDAMTPTPSARLHAHEAWAALVARGFRPTAKHVNALVAGFTHAGLMSDAHEVLRLAKDAGIEPPVEALTDLMMGYGRLRDADRIMAVYRQAKGSGVSDLAAVCAVVRALCEAGQYEQALRLADRDLPADGLDEMAVLAVAHVLRKTNNMAGMFDFIEQRCAQPADPARPSSATSYILTAQLRRLVRKSLDYLHKQAVLAGSGAPALSFRFDRQHDADVAELDTLIGRANRLLAADEAERAQPGRARGRTLGLTPAVRRWLGKLVAPTRGRAGDRYGKLNAAKARRIRQVGVARKASDGAAGRQAGGEAAESGV